MAKGILEYDLNDPDDIIAHQRAVKSLDMALVLWEMAYNTKKGIQNQIEFDNLDAYEAVNKIFEKLHEEMNDRGINLDDLIV
jgi:di/tripeptidase